MESTKVLGNYDGSNGVVKAANSYLGKPYVWGAAKFLVLLIVVVL